MTMSRIAAALAFFTATFAAILSAQAPGRWVTDKYAPLPYPEEEFTAVVAKIGRAHV